MSEFVSNKMSIAEGLQLLGQEFWQKEQFGLIIAPDGSRVAVKDFSDATLTQLLKDRSEMDEDTFLMKYVLTTIE